MTHHAYAAAQRQTLTGRALEREVFARVTARLAGAEPDAPDGAAALAAALDENRRLWMTLAVDLASAGNACPPALKAGLLSLAAFVESHTAAVQAGRARRDALVEVNRNVIAGLTADALAEVA